MGKISNCFKMLELLASGRVYNAKELSEKLEVNPRMIRQYKDDLEKAGIYISSIRGPLGGYCLDYDFNLPVRGISKKELDYLNKINDPMINEIVIKLKNLSIKEIDINNRDLYNKITDAITNNQKMKITYKSTKGSVRKRIIHPQAMFCNLNIWRVQAFCEYKKDIRRFRLDAILNCEKINDFF